jgi:hypothetical protein
MKSLILSVIMVGLVLFGVSVKALDSDGLVLLLLFDEGAGDTVEDLSGMGNNGVIQGAEWANGKIGSALNFEPGDHVEIPHSDSLSITDEITVMAWTNMAAGASGEMAIVSKGTWAANDLPYELTQTPGGVIFWQFYDDGGRDSCSPSSPPVDEWHHIAGTYDGTVFKCYIDGQFAQEWAYAGTMPENDASVTIGKRSKANGTFFNGIIDEVAIFNRALTEEEVEEAMLGIRPLAVEPIDKCVCTWGSVKGQ